MNISALNHPSICTVHDIGEQDGQAFIAMGFLDGMTLNHRIARRTLDTDVLLPISYPRYLGPDLTINMQKGYNSAVSERRVASLLVVWMVPMTSGWHSFPKLSDYITNSDKNYGSARANFL